MKRDAFRLLHGMEDSWWYRGRAAVVHSILTREIGSLSLKDALDFGAGYGGMSESLKTFCSQAYAFEPDDAASTIAGTRGYTQVFPSAEEALARHYSLIGLFDVVEHMQDDRAGIENMKHALVPGGYLVITVPAFPYLWSVHDINHHHYRRYTKTTLKKLLEEKGFEVAYISYWNTILFIPAAFMRLIGRSGESALALPAFVNALFFAMVRVEAFFLRFMPLPFGTGLVAVARTSSPMPKVPSEKASVK
jgi:SAM-dependent methyltransferase